MDTLNKIKQHLATPAIGLGVRRRLKMADGKRVSIQANRFVCCEPRIDNAREYESAEYWIDGEPEPIFYAPLDDIAADIDRNHGGLAE